MDRLDRDTYFGAIAEIVAMRSTCLRAKVGAVLVDTHNRIISCGYNGAPRGMNHCTSETCNDSIDHCRATIHAEANALMMVSLDQAENSTLYCTHFPCADCARLALNQGVRKIIYNREYGDESSVDEVFWMFGPGRDCGKMCVQNTQLVSVRLELVDGMRTRSIR